MKKSTFSIKHYGGVHDLFYIIINDVTDESTLYTYRDAIKQIEKIKNGGLKKWMFTSSSC